MLKYLRKNNGITLISLVVTVIVLIIIASVTINVLLRDGGSVDRIERNRGAYVSVNAKDTVEVILLEYKLQRGLDNNYLTTYLDDKKTKGQIDDYRIIDSRNIEIQIGKYLVTADFDDFSIKNIRNKNPKLQDELDKLENSNIPGDAVAKYNEKYYRTLEAALADTRDFETQQIVLLLKDTSENVTIPENKNILLYLNEKTITNKESNPIITVNGILEIENGTINGTYTEKKATIFIDENAELYSENATVERNSESDYSWETITNKGKTFINHSKVSNTSNNTIDNSGTLQITSGSEMTTVSATSVYNEATGNLLITGGSISSETKYAISNQGTVKIEGGNISSDSGTVIYNQVNSDMEITGGSILPQSKIAINCYGKLKISGNAEIKSEAENYPTIYAQSGSEVVIAGGTITAESSNAIWNRTGSTVRISGGNISSNTGSTISNQTNANLEITGGNITSQGGNTIYVSGTLNISGKPQIGSETSSYPTIYLNGGSTATISGGNISSNTGSTISNQANANLEITGGKIVAQGNNAVVSYGTLAIRENPEIIGKGEGYPTIYVASGSTATIAGGDISSEKNTAIANEGTLNIMQNAKIGSTTSAVASIYLRANSITEITGGKIYSTSTTTNAINLFGKLTIGGTAEISSSGASYPTICVQSGSEATITGGTITGVTSYGIWNKTGGKTTITGGNISSNSGNGVNNQANGTLTISGGTIKSTASCAIMNRGTLEIAGTANVFSEAASVVTLSNYGSLTQNGGSIYAPSSNAIKNQANGTITINAGRVYADANNAIWNLENGSCTIAGGNIYTDVGNVVKNYGNLSITGGDISSENDYAVYNLSTGVAQITGGKLYSEKNVIGSYGTVEIGGTADVSSEAANSPTVINFNGGELTVSGGKISAVTTNAIWNKAGANTSITGGNVISSNTTIHNLGKTSINGTATITSDSSTACVIYSSEETSELIVGGGSISSLKNRAVVNNGIMTMTGGNIYSPNTPINNTKTLVISGTAEISGGSIYNDISAELEITNGTFTSEGRYAIISNSGKTTISGGNFNSKFIGISNASGSDNNVPFIGELTITGGNFVSSERFSVVVNSGIFTLEGGTLTSTGTIEDVGSWQEYIGVVVNMATFVMNGGSISTNEKYGLYQYNKNDVEGNAQTTINNGSITSNTDYGIYNKDGTVTINGGTISSRYNC